MSEGLDNINSLKEKVDKLKSLFENVREERDSLREKNEQCEDELVKAKKRYDELEVKYRNMQIAQVFSSNNNDNASAKNKIDKIVREIDKCIALLNQ